MKSVLKTTPVPPYDLLGLERWLEEQANQGLLPEWVNREFTQFRRDASAPGARFRLEASNGREAPESERLELYQESGWQYVDTVCGIYFLFCALSPDSVELHTDLATRGVSLEWLAGRVKKARRKNRIWHLFVLGILALGGILVWQIDPRRVPLMLLDLAGLPLLLLPPFFWGWRREEREYRLLLDLQSTLELGLIPKPGRPRRRLPFWIDIPLAGLTTLLCIWVIFAQPFTHPKPTPLENFSGTYVSLQQLEPEPLATYEELFGEEPSHDWDDNTVTRKFSLLSPSYYRVDQNLFSRKDGISKNTFSSSGDERYRYSPSLEGVYFRLTVPALARTIALSQMAELEAVNLTWHCEELEYPGLDFVFLARSVGDDIGKIAAVAKGGRVAVFRYSGREDLAGHLDVLAEGVKP